MITLKMSVLLPSMGNDITGQPVSRLLMYVLMYVLMYGLILVWSDHLWISGYLCLNVIRALPMLDAYAVVGSNLVGFRQYAYRN